MPSRFVAQSHDCLLNMYVAQGTLPHSECKPSSREARLLPASPSPSSRKVPLKHDDDPKIKRLTLWCQDGLLCRVSARLEFLWHSCESLDEAYNRDCTGTART